jgi:hypothetical protein
MRRSKDVNPAVAALGAWWVHSVILPARAFHYACTAHHDERGGFSYTAAIEWRNAAESFAPYTLAAEYCWRQWERIMHLPRQFSGPIDPSRMISIPLNQISVTQSATNQAALPMAA